jgi:nucleoside-diphosphate-sugar epimerase
MNYLISGRSGFIGTALTEYLTGKGHDVYPILRDQSVARLTRYFKEVNPDYIIHLAAYGNHYHQADFQKIVNANIVWTYTILEAAQFTNYKLFYNVSSSSVTLKQQTNYSITKLCAENLVAMYDRTITCRPYSVYGPGESNEKFIPQVIKHLHSGEQMIVDEKSSHDWIYISDFIKGLLNGETELGTGVKTTNREVIVMLEHISGKKLNYISCKLRNYDNSDWVTKKGVSSIGVYWGLKKTYDYLTQ